MSYAVKVHDQHVMEGFPGTVKLHGDVANEEDLEKKLIGGGESKDEDFTERRVPSEQRWTRPHAEGPWDLIL